MCLSCFPNVEQQPVSENSINQLTLGHRGGVNRQLPEGIFVKQFLFCPGTSWVYTRVWQKSSHGIVFPFRVAYSLFILQ